MKEKNMPSWVVYILKSLGRDFLYIGFTHNLHVRLSQHHDGVVQSTKAYRPLRVVAYVAVQSERKAREVEKYFKSGWGKAILRKRILADEVPQRGT